MLTFQTDNEKILEKDKEVTDVYRIYCEFVELKNKLVSIGVIEEEKNHEIIIYLLKRMEDIHIFKSSPFKINELGSNPGQIHSLVHHIAKKYQKDHPELIRGVHENRS